MSLKKNLVYNILLTVSNMIFPIISFPYAARVLGPDGTGEVNFAQSFCQYFIIIAALGVTVYGVREIAKAKDNPELITKSFIELFIIRIACTLLILIPYFIVILTVDKFAGNLPLYYWGAFFIFINISAIEWFFTGLENFRYITLRSLIIKVFALVLLFFFVRKRSDILPYFLINVVTVFLSGVYNIKYMFKFLKFKHIKLSELEFRKHLTPLVIIFSGILAINVYTLLDTIILGFLQNNEAVGLYNAATRITKISLTIITSLSTVLVPKLSYVISQNRHNEVSAILSRSFSFVYTLSIPMAVGLFVLAPELVQIFSGHEFAPATLTLRIMSPLIIVIGMASIFSTQILTPLAKDNFVMRSAIIGAVVSLCMNFLLVPLFKENGSAASNLIAEISVTVICFVFAKKFMRFDVKLIEGFYNLLGTTPYFIIVYLFRTYTHNNILIIGGTMLLASMCFFIFNIFIIKNELVINAVGKYLKLGLVQQKRS